MLSICSGVGARNLWLHVVDRETPSRCVSDLRDVLPVGGDNGVVSTHGAFCHCDINDVIETAESDQRADSACAVLAEFFDTAAFSAVATSCAEVHRARLRPAPRLGSSGVSPSRSAARCNAHISRSSRSARYQRAGVVGESISAHALLAVSSPSSRSRRASPAARSSALSSPASASHSRIPRKALPKQQCVSCSRRKPRRERHAVFVCRGLNLLGHSVVEGHRSLDHTHGSEW